MVTKNVVCVKLATSVAWLERGILAINARQTEDEKSSKQTKHENGRGWNKTDASFGAYLAGYIRGCKRPEGKRLTGDFITKARRLMRKYAGQLARTAAEHCPVLVYQI